MGQEKNAQGGERDTNKPNEKTEEESDRYKNSLNGMLGPGDVDYDEEGFVIERKEEPIMEEIREFANFVEAEEGVRVSEISEKMICEWLRENKKPFQYSWDGSLGATEDGAYFRVITEEGEKKECPYDNESGSNYAHTSHIKERGGVGCTDFLSGLIKKGVKIKTIKIGEWYSDCWQGQDCDEGEDFDGEASLTIEMLKIVKLHLFRKITEEVSK